MAADTHDLARDQFMLTGKLARQGYDWWWHSFTGTSRRTGEERSFFVEFFLCNPGLGGAEPILGQLPKNREAGVKPSYLMVKVGCWGKGARQLHRFFGWDDVQLGEGVPYWVAADDCLACETDLLGHVSVSAEDAAAHPEWMSDAGSMLWDLHLTKDIAYNVGYGAGKPLRDAQAFEMFWHAEGMKTRYEGTVVLDGEEFVVSPDTSWGYADKNWGSDFTSPWLWLSSCDLVSSLSGERLANSAFDIGGGRPKVGPLTLNRRLLGCLNYEGTPYEFNFSKPWTLSRTRFDCHETDDAVVWHVEQGTAKARLVCDVTCPKDEMLLINYEAPDGAKRYSHLWNGGTGTGRLQLLRRTPRGLKLVDDMRVAHVGCEYGEYDPE